MGDPRDGRTAARWRMGRWGAMALAPLLVVCLVVIVLAGAGRLPVGAAPRRDGGAPPPPTAFGPVDPNAPTTPECAHFIEQPCYGPAQMQEAFRLTPLYRRGLDGRGQTIVIIGGGAGAGVAADLAAFDHAWGLPDPPSLRILPTPGYTPVPCASDRGGTEIENLLDVEWAHAIAPGAAIALVLAPTDAQCQQRSLVDPVAYALDARLGQIISISFGSSELRDPAGAQIGPESPAHAVFERAARLGVTVLATAGDDGATTREGERQGLTTPSVLWPASDPDVLAVGGTTLRPRTDFGVYGSETVWNDGADGGATGGGLSALFAQPGYQRALPGQDRLAGRRALPDVAFPAQADYLLYGSYSLGMGRLQAKWAHWHVAGGDSAATPCWAGLIAIADQLRGAPLGLAQPALYRLAGHGMHDVTTGDNSFGGVQGYAAGSGFDLATGWGTPIGEVLLPALARAADDGASG